MLIYRLTNRVNGKAYIGLSSRKVRFRLSRHPNDAKHGSKVPLHRAIRKYGWDAFDVEVICCARNMTDLIACEIALIEQEQTFAPNGYNATRGGEGAVGGVKSAGEIARLSERMKQWIASGKIKLRAPGTFTHSEETRTKMRGPRRPLNLTAEQREKRGDHHRGDRNIMRRSREAALRAVANRRRWTATPEQLRRMREGYRRRANTKLDPQRVGMIKALLNIGRKQTAIARLYRVAPSVICNIKYGRAWPDVPAFVG